MKIREPVCADLRMEISDISPGETILFWLIPTGGGQVLSDLKLGQTITVCAAQLGKLPVHVGDIVTVTDRSGRKTRLEIHLLVGKDFAVVGLPGRKIGLADKIRFGMELWKK